MMGPRGKARRRQIAIAEAFKTPTLENHGKQNAYASRQSADLGWISRIRCHWHVDFLGSLAAMPQSHAASARPTAAGRAAPTSSCKSIMQKFRVQALILAK
jgi:hypothetical protein